MWLYLGLHCIKYFYGSQYKLCPATIPYHFPILFNAREVLQQFYLDIPQVSSHHVFQPKFTYKFFPLLHVTCKWHSGFKIPHCLFHPVCHYCAVPLATPDFYGSCMRDLCIMKCGLTGSTTGYVGLHFNSLLVVLWCHTLRHWMEWLFPRGSFLLCLSKLQNKHHWG
jgi:hypothetical protein